METNVYQRLYRSRSTYRPSEAQLREMLALARLHNSRKQITGLLLYSEGIFVQMIEGPAAEIRELYARIQCDSRHTQVETVSESLLPKRKFAEWSMDFDLAEAPEVERVLGAIKTQHPLPAAARVLHRQYPLANAAPGVYRPPGQWPRCIIHEFFLRFSPASSWAGPPCAPSSATCLPAVTPG
nr:BLUF domain-containing protein [Hymenobacter siberiensis]